jgi:hypothetical protein
MRQGLSFGYSTAAAKSQSENDWKEKLRRIGLFLLLVALLALFFRYLTHSVERKISATNSAEVGWDVTTQ